MRLRRISFGWRIDALFFCFDDAAASSATARRSWSATPASSSWGAGSRTRRGGDPRWPRVWSRRHRQAPRVTRSLRWSTSRLSRRRARRSRRRC